VKTGQAIPETLGAHALVVRDVKAAYNSSRRAPQVLHGIDLTVPRGGSVAVVGESGSGKSTLAKVIVGQLHPASGEVQVKGRDVLGLSGRDLMDRYREVQLIPQDPNSSLDPYMTVGDAIAEAINPRRPNARRDRDRISELLTMVSLDPAFASRKPHEFSGGQRQRIVIARALAVNPSIIVADEVTSALDATVQGEILELLRHLRESMGLAFVFITHDLSIAQYMCDEVVVLYRGNVVESGHTDLLTAPHHPYTQALVHSVPDPEGKFLQAIA
jgi:peptide/nickel transport system ATP-binding protein